MTEFSVEILRLHGDEPWEQWGGDWWSHADRLGTVPAAGPGGWQLLDHFRAAGVSGRQLDWGALLFPVTREELLELIPGSAELRPPASHPGAPAVTLAGLPGDADYGLVVVECS
jgi:hypothetical protein